MAFHSMETILEFNDAVNIITEFCLRLPLTATIEFSHNYATREIQLQYKQSHNGSPVLLRVSCDKHGKWLIDNMETPQSDVITSLQDKLNLISTVSLPHFFMQAVRKTRRTFDTLVTNCTLYEQYQIKINPDIASSRIYLSASSDLVVCVDIRIIIECNPSFYRINGTDEQLSQFDFVLFNKLKAFQCDMYTTMKLLLSESNADECDFSLDEANDIIYVMQRNTDDMIYDIKFNQIPSLTSCKEYTMIVNDDQSCKSYHELINVLVSARKATPAHAPDPQPSAAPPTPTALAAS